MSTLVRDPDRESPTLDPQRFAAAAFVAVIALLGAFTLVCVLRDRGSDLARLERVHEARRVVARARDAAARVAQAPRDPMAGQELRGRLDALAALRASWRNGAPSTCGRSAACAEQQGLDVHLTSTLAGTRPSSPGTPLTTELDRVDADLEGVAAQVRAGMSARFAFARFLVVATALLVLGALGLASVSVLPPWLHAVETGPLEGAPRASGTGSRTATTRRRPAAWGRGPRLATPGRSLARGLRYDRTPCAPTVSSSPSSEPLPSLAARSPTRPSMRRRSMSRTPMRAPTRRSRAMPRPMAETRARR